MGSEHDNSLVRTPSDPSASGALSRMRALLDRPLTEAQVAENTAAVAREAEQCAGDRESLLVIRVGTERLALPADDVHRVMPVSTVRRVPHRSNSVVAGLANIGGELTLVANIGAVLGVLEPARHSHFVVIGAQTSRWAFAVSEIEGVFRVARSAFVAAPATVRHAADGCADHVVRIALPAAAEPPGSAPHGHAPRDGRATEVATGLDTVRATVLVTVLDAPRLCQLFDGGLA